MNRPVPAPLLDTASVEVVRVHTEYGPAAARKGVLAGMLFGQQAARGGRYWPET